MADKIPCTAQSLKGKSVKENERATVYKIKVLGWQQPLGAKRQHLFVTPQDAPYDKQIILSCCKKWQESAWGITYDKSPLHGIKVCVVCQNAANALAQNKDTNQTKQGARTEQE